MIIRVFFLFLVLLAGCSKPANISVVHEEPVKQPIIGGSVCGEQDEPSAAALIVSATMKDQTGRQFSFLALMCTGTLIAPDVVLTAAHCVDPSLLGRQGMQITSLRYFISFQADLRQWSTGQAKQPPSDAIEAAKVMFHEKWNIQNLVGPGLGNPYDVGLVFLSRAVTSRDPMMMPTKQEAQGIKVGQRIKIVGWGQQWHDPVTSPVGQKVCADSWINELGAAEFQVGSDVNSPRKCHGDSGGPSYTDLSGGRRVIGITSHAYDHTDCLKGGVDMRVDALLPWIDAQLRGMCEAKKRAWCDVPGVIPPPQPPAPGPAPAPGSCCCTI